MLLLASTEPISLTPPDITYNDFLFRLMVNDSIQGWEVTKVGTLPIWIGEPEHAVKIWRHLPFFKKDRYGVKKGQILTCSYTLPGVNDCELVLSLDLTSIKHNSQQKESVQSYKHRLNQWKQSYRQFYYRHFIVRFIDRGDMTSATGLWIRLNKKERNLMTLYFLSATCNDEELSTLLLQRAAYLGLVEAQYKLNKSNSDSDSDNDDYNFDINDTLGREEKSALSLQAFLEKGIALTYSTIWCLRKFLEVAERIILPPEEDED